MWKACARSLNALKSTRQIRSFGSVQPAYSSQLECLEQHIESQKAQEALQVFKSMEEPVSNSLTQKLAIMLAKKGNYHHAKEAYQVLQRVYMNPALKPDDYTKLAFIFVVDSCLRNKLLKHALEATEEAHNVGIRLDLPAYNDLVDALVNADQPDEAVIILNDISSDEAVSPDEATYFTLIQTFIDQREFATAAELIDQARCAGVKFSSESYSEFLSLASEVDDNSDSLDRMLTYLDHCMSEDKVNPFEDFIQLDPNMNDDDGQNDDDEDADDGDDTTDLK